jgi:hypothetical protein
MATEAPTRLLFLKLHGFDRPAGDGLLKAVPLVQTTVPLAEANLQCLRQLAYNAFETKLGVSSAFSLHAEVDFGDGLELSCLSTDLALDR